MSLAPSFDELTSRFREFMDSCSQDAVTCHEFQFDRFALELFSLQFNRNAAYRIFCEARNATPSTVSHWAEIPAVPAAAFKDLDLTSLSDREYTTVFHSSGTTGQKPSRHFHNAQSLALYETSLLSGFFSAAFPGAQPSQAPGNTRWHLGILTPPPFQAPHSSLVHMFDTLRRAFGEADAAFLGKIGVNRGWTSDSETVVAFLNKCSGGDSPVLFLGTAFSYVHLLDYLIAQGLQFTLPSGSRVLETGGYKGLSRFVPKTELHELITERLGVQSSQIICEYGMSELSSQAYDRPPGFLLRKSAKNLNQTRFLFPPWVKAQIVSPETGAEVSDGETGLLTIIDLANVYSVMAIQTEDLGIRRDEGFELLGRNSAAEPRGCSLMAI